MTSRIETLLRSIRYGLSFSFGYTPLSERQIVCSIRSLGKTSGLLLRLLDGTHTGLRESALRISGCRRNLLLTHRLRRIVCIYTPCTYVIIPTSVVFARIDVEIDRIELAHLNIKLFEFILTKYIECHAARILLLSLNNKILSHPRITRRLSSSLTRLKRRNYLTCYFHL